MAVYIIGGGGLIVMLVIAVRTSRPWGWILSLMTGVLISAVLREWGIFP